MNSLNILRSSLARSRPGLCRALSTADGPPVAPESSYRYREPEHNPLRAGASSAALAAQVQEYHLSVLSTANNTIATFSKTETVIARFSGGSCGFKGFHRGGYEAGYQCAVRMFARIAAERDAVGPMVLELFYKGVGQGREAFSKSLVSSEGANVRGMVVRITDRTPIKVGGTRAKKRRRI